MSYEPTNWKAGDTVTSAKLNKLEQGVANNGVLVIHQDENGILDRTWQEIHDAACAICIFDENQNNWGARTRGLIGSTMYESNQYEIYIGSDTWTTSTPDGYPSFKINPPSE